MTPILAFDIETVPDIAGLRLLHGIEAQISDHDVAEFAFRERRARTGHDFLPLHQHRVVAIACALRDEDSFRCWSLGSAEEGEAVLIRRFFDGIEKYTPQLVSWNGGGFDLLAGEKFAPGIVALLTPDAPARQVADGIAFPNGMAVTPDNSTLIIAESYGKRLTAFDIAADGSLSNRRVWADLEGGVPDGICVDADSAVWYADVPNKRCVRVREGGEVMQTINLDRGCFACMLGGADRRTLFLMVNRTPDVTQWGKSDTPRTGRVLTINAPSPGAGWPCN